MATSWQFVYAIDNGATLLGGPLYANPNATGDSFAHTKEITYAVNATLDGRTVIMSGGFSHRKYTFSGILYTEEDVTFMENFVVADRASISDDLGRFVYVVPEELSMDRDYSEKWPWKHTYTMTCQEYDTTLPGPS